MKTLLAWAVIALITPPQPARATVLITGSDRGLGLEFAKEYAERGWNVIATTRHPETATKLKALASEHNNIAIEKLDLLDRPGIKLLAAKYSGQPIDVLINNAGTLGDGRGQVLGRYDYGTFQQVMAVNVYGPLAVSEAFRDNLFQGKQKKIIAITSGEGIISSQDFVNRWGTAPIFYRASKVAMNMCMKGLAQGFRGRGVIVGILSPGVVDTEMWAGMSESERAKLLQPSQSVLGMIKVIDGLTQTNSGQPLNYDGTVLPW